MAKYIMKTTGMPASELLYQRSLVGLLLVSCILLYNKINIFELKKEAFPLVMIRVIGNIFGFLIELMAVKWT